MSVLGNALLQLRPAEQAIHFILMFMLGAFAWFQLSLGMLRQSAAMYTAGSLFIYLMLIEGVMPYLRWFDHAGTVLLGAAVAQWLSVAVWKFLPYRNIRAEIALLTSIIAVALVITQTRAAYVPLPENAAAVAGAVALVAMGFYLVSVRQRTTASSIAVWLFWICLIGLLLQSAFLPADRRPEFQFYTPWLLMGLMFIAALFTFDNLQVERQLRRGPHLQLDASLKDPLTGLANRRALELHGPQLLHQSHEAGRPVSMIIADIDFFKRVNDTHGHLTGDAALRQTAKTLAGQVRKSDLVARYGGEEFIIILPGSPLVPALRLAERMRHAIESATIHHDGLDLRITASFGVATSFPEEPMPLNALIARADANLYRAKHNGRNCVMTDELPHDVI